MISFGGAAAVDFAIEPLHDGQVLSLGDVQLRILETPGHTPESICIVVYEHAGDNVPYGVLTGDTLFVGDVGRPDLLASAGSGLSADVLARSLYRSLRDKVLELPDAARVFPADGAGSSCGKQLSSETSSTVGEQRRVNYALQPMTEDEFVEVVVEGQPVRPHYFEFDARRNRELRPLLDEDIAPRLLDIGDVLSRQAAGAMLLDTREPADFAAGHLRGAVNVGLQGRFAEWAGDVLDASRAIVLVGDPDAAVEARVRLGRIGFDRVVGQLRDPGLVFSERADLIDASSRLTIEQLAELRGLVPALQLVDVRNPGETRDGTLPGAREIPLPVLVDSLDAIAPDLPVVVYCASGYRSSIAASVLRSAGWTDVSDLLGGFGGWEGAELPVSHGAVSTAADAPEVSAGEGDKLVAAGALLLDVREPDEWDLGHAPGAALIPMGQVHDRLSEISEGERVVVICRSGGRSAAVTQVLRSRGYDAVNLAGGMRAWAKLGLPVVATSGAPGTVD